MLVMFLARKWTRAALSEISRTLGRKSHSTVVSAQHKVTEWLADGKTVPLGSRPVPRRRRHQARRSRSCGWRESRHRCRASATGFVLQSRHSHFISNYTETFPCAVSFASLVAACFLAERCRRRRCRSQHADRRRKGRRLEAAVRRQDHQRLAELQARPPSPPAGRSRTATLVRGSGTGRRHHHHGQVRARSNSRWNTTSRKGGNSGLMFHVDRRRQSRPGTPARKSRFKTARAPPRSAEARLALSALPVRSRCRQARRRVEPAPPARSRPRSARPG